VQDYRELAENMVALVVLVHTESIFGLVELLVVWNFEPVGSLAGCTY